MDLYAYQSFFIPAQPRVALHIYYRREGRGVALFQANL